jgi:hypothetical protein
MNTKDQVLKLPNDHPEVIKAFLYLGYRNSIFISTDVTLSGVDSLPGPFGLLAKLLVLGDVYYIKSLQNDVIDAMITCFNQFTLPFDIIPFVYENTSESSSPIRRLLVKYAERRFKAHEIDCEELKLPAEFLSDMCRNLLHFREAYQCVRLDETDSPDECNHLLEVDTPVKQYFEVRFCTDFHYHGGVDYSKEAVCWSIKQYDC